MRGIAKEIAKFAPHFPKERKFGNRPLSGSIYEVSSQGVEDAKFTVELCHNAAKALATPSPAVEALVALVEAVEREVDYHKRDHHSGEIVTNCDCDLCQSYKHYKEALCQSNSG